MVSSSRLYASQLFELVEKHFVNHTLIESVCLQDPTPSRHRKGQLQYPLYRRPTMASSQEKEIFERYSL